MAVSVAAVSPASVSSTASRASIDSSNDVKTPDYFSILQTGAKFTKLGRSGSPHVTTLRVEMKGSIAHVTWSHANGKPSSSLPVSSITRIISGQRTPVFARVASQTKYTSPSQLGLSLSIMYRDAGAPVIGADGEPTEERSLDVIAVDKTSYDVWWKGLHQLLPPKAAATH